MNTPLLPLTKVAIVDVEGLGLECRWNTSLPVYFVGILEVDHMSRRTIRKYWTVEQAKERIEELLADGWAVGGHNFKFDLTTFVSRGLTHIISKHSLSMFCTMVMEYSRNSSLSSYSLDALTGMKTDVITSAQEIGLLEEGISKKHFWSVDWSNNRPMLEHIASYCVDDLKATWSLYKRLVAWYNLPEHEKFRQALISLEFPMLSVLAHMESRGIHIDTEALESLTKDCKQELETHKQALDKVAKFLPKLQWDAEEEDYKPVAKVYKGGLYTNKKTNVSHYMDANGAIVASNPYVVGDYCPVMPYNSASATGHTYWLIKQQCPEVLEKAEQTPKGKPKLNKDFFADVADELPESLPIAKFLKATKNLQMCVSVAEHIRDNRIHGSFNNCLTRTGRLSSSNPNLQNVQRSDDNPRSVGSRFRQLFTASSEVSCMLVADLDRIEIVVLAWFLLVAMKDSSLADVCNTPGSDPHQANADKWGVKRFIAKTLIFLLVYGGGASLIYRRGMAPTLEDAENMVTQVDEAQPAINKLKDRVWAKAKERGYVTNPFNSRGVYPELYSKKKWLKSAGERKSFNFLIQRTARDVLHTLVIDSLVVVLKYGASLVNVVHDEVIIECDVTVADDLMQELAPIWNRRGDILKGVYINGDWNKGKNWYEAK